MQQPVRPIVPLLLLLLAVAAPARADGGGVFTPREWSVRAGGGISPNTKIEYYALHGSVGLGLWDPIERWFAGHGIDSCWVIEPWVAYVRDAHGRHQTESFEIGVSPLFARLTFGGGPLRPFVEGGEGILYTDLRKQDFGTRMQFSSQLGAGLEYALRPDLALTIAGRFRHISNAGMSKSDPGLNTVYGLVGITFR